MRFTRPFFSKPSIFLGRVNDGKFDLTVSAKDGGRTIHVVGTMKQTLFGSRVRYQQLCIERLLVINFSEKKPRYTLPVKPGVLQIKRRFSIENQAEEVGLSCEGSFEGSFLLKREIRKGDEAKLKPDDATPGCSLRK
jgi:hypothetical protein